MVHNVSYIPQLDSVVSTSNSTTTPLAISGVFTGTGEDVSDFATISLMVKSDVDGVCQIQFSNDNTNWDISISYTISAGVAFDVVRVVTGKYYRVVYTNGLTIQIYLRLQTIPHKEKAVPPIAQNAISAVSTTNSTNSVLLASASFTGTSEQVSTYSSKLLQCIAIKQVRV